MTFNQSQTYASSFSLKLCLSEHQVHMAEHYLKNTAFYNIVDFPRWPLMEHLRSFPLTLKFPLTSNNFWKEGKNTSPTIAFFRTLSKNMNAFSKHLSQSRMNEYGFKFFYFLYLLKFFWAIWNRYSIQRHSVGEIFKNEA